MQSRRRRIESFVDRHQAVSRDDRECGQGIDQRVHTGGLWGELFRPVGMVVQDVTFISLRLSDLARLCNGRRVSTNEGRSAYVLKEFVIVISFG